jgi:hypothetical protein
MREERLTWTLSAQGNRHESVALDVPLDTAGAAGAV